MRQIQESSWSHYAPYVGVTYTVTEAQAQHATLQTMGDAIKQERRLLQNALDALAENAVAAEMR